MNRKILVTVVFLVSAALLATPLVVTAGAKPTIASFAFRVETWPDLAGDFDKFKHFSAGESENGVIIRIPSIGNAPLIDDVPDNTWPSWYQYLGRGGVRLTIDGMGTYVGNVTQMVIHSNFFANEVKFSIEKWTFTFDEGTLEVSVNTANGEGKCIGTRGTGIFAGVKFSGTFDTHAYEYTIPVTSPPLSVQFKIQEGTGEVMFT